MKPKRNCIRLQRKETIHENKKGNRDKAFDEAKNCTMIDPSVLKSKDFQIIQEEYLLGNRKWLDYVCNICQKCEY